MKDATPELSAADLVDEGFVLAGGGALIRGLDQYLNDGAGLPIIIARPTRCGFANGTRNGARSNCY